MVASMAQRSDSAERASRKAIRPTARPQFPFLRRWCTSGGPSNRSLVQIQSARFPDSPRTASRSPANGRTKARMPGGCGAVRAPKPMQNRCTGLECIGFSPAKSPTPLLSVSESQNAPNRTLGSPRTPEAVYEPPRCLRREDMYSLLDVTCQRFAAWTNCSTRCCEISNASPTSATGIPPLTALRIAASRSFCSFA